MKRLFSAAVIQFADKSKVSWEYIGMERRLYKDEKRYRVHVHVENPPNSIDQYFETWDKPSIHQAEYFIKRAIKEAKSPN